MDSRCRYSMKLGFLSKRVYRKLLPLEWHREQLQRQSLQGNQWRLMLREAVVVVERQPVVGVVGTLT